MLDTLAGVPVEIGASLIMQELFGFQAENYYRYVPSCLILEHGLRSLPCNRYWVPLLVSRGLGLEIKVLANGQGRVGAVCIHCWLCDPTRGHGSVHVARVAMIFRRWIVEDIGIGAGGSLSHQIILYTEGQTNWGI